MILKDKQARDEETRVLKEKKAKDESPGNARVLNVVKKRKEIPLEVRAIKPAVFVYSQDKPGDDVHLVSQNQDDKKKQVTIRLIVEPDQMEPDKTVNEPIIIEKKFSMHENTIIAEASLSKEIVLPDETTDLDSSVSVVGENDSCHPYERVFQFKNPSEDLDKIVEEEVQLIKERVIQAENERLLKCKVECKSAGKVEEMVRREEAKQPQPLKKESESSTKGSKEELAVNVEKKNEFEVRARLLKEKKLKEEECRLLKEKKANEEVARLLREKKVREEEERILKEKKLKEIEARLVKDKKVEEEERVRLVREKKANEEQKARLIKEKRLKEEQDRLLKVKKAKEDEERKIREKRVRDEQARLLKVKLQKEEEARLLAKKKAVEEEKIRLLKEKRLKDEEKARLSKEKRQKDRESRILKEKTSENSPCALRAQICH